MRILSKNAYFVWNFFYRIVNLNKALINIIFYQVKLLKKNDFFFSPETANLTKVGSLVGVFESETNETHERY